MLNNRAWSTLDIKAVDSEQRIIEGIASTPSVDRGGDIMEPAGAKFSLPMPFLWFHDSQKPIGEVFDAKVVPNGIYIKARVSKVDTPGPLKDRVDEAWQSFTATPPLVRGLSIGWNDLKSVPVPGTKFTHVLEWLWGELSAVTVPMNVDATILAVKNIDMAASGLPLPRVTGTLPVVSACKDAPVMTNTIPEQIKNFENTRAAKAGRMTSLMNSASETGSTLDPAQAEEYETLSDEVKSVDAHLTRLRDMERLNVVAATRITGTATVEEAAAVRGGVTQTSPVISVKANLPKGTALTRFAMAMASGKGDYMRTLARAETWHDSTPEVELMVKAAVAAGSTSDATWAGPLVVAQPMVNEFLELLRPRTLIGRIPGFRQVPFNVSVPAQTAGGTYSWVGQGAAKPVTKADFATVTLGFAKAAGIIVLTEELVKLSSPSAEATVREEMIAGMQQFLDSQLTDPTVAEVAGVNPASITNGAPTAAASGTTGAAARIDLAAQIAAFTAADIPLAGSVLLMNESNAFALGIALNALGQSMFPGVGRDGGSILGIPIVVTNAVSNRIVLVHAPSILFADDGGVNIDVSREASLQMDNAPTNPTDATTVLVSLWQRNLIGLRAERFITWKRARTGSVRVITGAAYTGA